MYGNHTNYRTCYVRISHTTRTLKCQCSHPYTSLHRGHANKVKELIEQSNQTVEGLILASKKPTQQKKQKYDFPLSSHKIPLCLPPETKKAVCNDEIPTECHPYAEDIPQICQCEPSTDRNGKPMNIYKDKD